MTFISSQLWRSINLQSIKVYYCFTTVYKEWKDQRKDQWNNQGLTIHPTISETGIMLFTLKIMLEVPHGKILTTLGANAFCQQLSVYHRHSLLYSCPFSLNKIRAQEKCHLVVRELLILVIGLSGVQFVQ